MTISKKNIQPATHFGKNLKFLRRLKGLSQAEVARLTDLNRSNIASYEHGIVEPNAHNFIKICAVFQVMPADMLSKILDRDAHEVITQSEITNQPLQKYLAEQIDLFTLHTNRLTKILEGYKTMQSLTERNDKEESDLDPGLVYQIENILEMLHALLEENWNLIQKFYSNSK